VLKLMEGQEDESHIISLNSRILFHGSMGELKEAHKWGFRGLERCKSMAEVCSIGSNCMMNVMADEDNTAEKIRGVAQTWWAKASEVFTAQYGPMPIRCTADLRALVTKPRIHIGYVSSNFSEHAVMRFLEALLQHHNRAEFDLFLYNCGSVSDGATQRIHERYKFNWRHVVGMPPQAIANLVRQDKIDVLVDVVGHTSENRLDIFFFHPAPVQVSMIGYAATTGFPSDIMNYKMADFVTNPCAKSRLEPTLEMTELPYRMDNCLLCYRVPEFSPPIGRSVAAGPECYVFGNFCRATKLTPLTLRLWRMVLEACPNSILLMRRPTDPAINPMTFGLIKKRMLDAGMPEEYLGTRVIFDGGKVPIEEYLMKYNQIDCLLDCAPYAGTTMTCESLSMGTPVVTLMGNTHRQNIAGSLLTHAGFSAWTTKTEAEFVRVARELYDAGPRSADDRTETAMRFRGSSVCDGAFYAKRIENAYKHMLTINIQKEMRDRPEILSGIVAPPK